MKYFTAGLLIATISLVATAPASNNIENCPKCPANNILRPVCGSDLKTYDNVSLIKGRMKSNMNLRILHEDACGTKAESSPECVLCPVTSLFGPVCGSDGRTYVNTSALQCKLKCDKVVTQVHEGKCTESE